MMHYRPDAVRCLPLQPRHGLPSSALSSVSFSLPSSICVLRISDSRHNDNRVARFKAESLAVPFGIQHIGKQCSISWY